MPRICGYVSRPPCPAREPPGTHSITQYGASAGRSTPAGSSAGVQVTSSVERYSTRREASGPWAVDAGPVESW